MSVRTNWKDAPIALLLVAVNCATAQAPPGPPPTRQELFRETLHGVELTDAYHWLEDLDSAETRSWIAAQNAYTRAVLEQSPAREHIRRRLTELMKIDTAGLPQERGGRYFYTKKQADQDLSVIYMRKSLRGADEVLIDPHSLSPDRTTNAQMWGVSQDGKLMAYTIRRAGQDEIEIRILDVDSRKDLPDRLAPGLYSQVSFTRDNSGLYYARRTRERGGRIFYHKLGSDPAQDTEVFGAGTGPNQFLSAEVSEGGEYLLLGVQHGWARSDLYYQHLPSRGEIRPLVKDVAALFDADWVGPRQLVVQSAWKAPKGRLLLADLADPAPEKWREIVPEGSDSIRGFAVIGGKLFVTYLHNVQTQIRIFSLEGKPLGEVPLPGVGSGGISGRWNSHEGILFYSSFTAPFRSYRYDARDRATELWFESKVPLRPEEFETRQVWYNSKDGTRVPMFVVHKKGLKPDGQRPTLLYGYGGFNVSLTPSFTPAAVLWAEAGGVYALVNLRGGSEFGEEWHRAGMLEKKQNVFDDFIAAAEWLIRNNYTNPARLAIQGGSNGGLLMGAALTQRPDLFQAVLCQYPDLDMVRYYRYTRNNNPPALLEYGNASDPAQFPFLRAYSPYERVTPGAKYPAVLLTTGEGDTRVPPQQACKMAAKLQAATTSGRPVLLRFDSKAGHAGGRPFSRILEDMADEYGFLFRQLGMDRASEAKQQPRSYRRTSVPSGGGNRVKVSLWSLAPKLGFTPAVPPPPLPSRRTGGIRGNCPLSHFALGMLHFPCNHAMANHEEHSFTVVFEPAEEGGYVVTCPALPGLVTEGDTLEEARERARDAIRAYLESLRKDGLPIPQDIRKEPVTEQIKVGLQLA